MLNNKEWTTEVFDADHGRISLRFKLNELKRYRYLLTSLVQRDLKSRYKNSILGVLWSLLNPLALMIVFTLLFTVFSDNTQRQYPVFILVGLLPWQFFANSLTGGTLSIVSGGALIKKVYFPRELLPMGTLLANTVNFLISSTILVVLLYIFDIGLTVYALWFPVILLAQLIFTLGLTLFLSALTVFYRDVLMILDVIITAWFFMTPIFYPFEMLGTSATIMGISFNPARLMRWVNPMASIVDGYRTVFWGTATSEGPVNMDPGFLLRTLTTAVIVLIIGYFFFARREHMFGEKL